MGILLNFETCVINGCSQIRFTETTGTYTSTNIGGYGTPNATLGSQTTSVLTITSPSGIVSTINLFTLGFPSNNKDFYYDIPTSVLNLTNIVDGQWTFTYTITDGTTILTRTKYSLFYCNSECCVTKMLESLKLEDCGCDCKDLEFSLYQKAFMFLQSLKNAARCGNYSSFIKLLKIISKLCINSGCNTCK